MMKILETRQEIANALNFGKYPVLTIDKSNKDDMYGFEGCKVRIDFGGNYYINATLEVYSDDKVLTTSHPGDIMSAGFGYHDIMSMLEWANAPIIKADQDVVVVVYDSKNKCANLPFIVHTAKTVNRFCSTPLDFEDANMGWMFE